MKHLLGAWITVAACTVFFVCGASASSPRAEPLDVEEVVNFFDDVALNGESSGRIVKWTKAPIVRLEVLASTENDYDTPVRIETSKADYDFVASHLLNLRQLTGLPVRLLPRDIGEGGDIVITITPWHLVRKTPVNEVPERLLRRLMGPGRCFFVLWPSPGNDIRKAHIVINSKLDKSHINHCFLEEITQSMGLPYDSDRVRPSIFNESSQQPRLSVYDMTLIRTLYDPKLTIDMPRADALVRARPIIQNWIGRPE